MSTDAQVRHIYLSLAGLKVSWFLCSALKKHSEDITSIVNAIASGDHKVLARAITIVENTMDQSEELLKSLKPNDIPVIGFTGPPGAGKSSVINGFLKHIISKNEKAAVIAVDPTSPFNYGSLLGDRLRMSEHFTSDNVFIRSVATRGSLGGLSEKIIEITDVLRSSDFDYVIIETVGVGQSEVEIAGLADTTIVILVPESGDEIQAMKSGIMEIADIFVVNKSDREGADQLVNNIRKILVQKNNWDVPVISTMATTGKGIEEIADQVTLHRKSGNFNEKKIYLLSEKAYRLIRSRKMRGLSKEDVRKMIEKAIREPGFNLFKFSEAFKND